MNKFFNKVAFGLGMLALTVMTFVTGSAAHAAADTDFATSSGTLTTSVTDNKGQWIAFGAGIIGAYLLIRIAFRAFNYGANKAISAVPGGGRRRR